MVKNGIDTHQAVALQKGVLVDPDVVSEAIRRARDGGADDLTLQEIRGSVISGARDAVDNAMYDD